MNCYRSPKQLVCWLQSRVLPPRSPGLNLDWIHTGPPDSESSALGPDQGPPFAHTREQLTMPSRKSGAKEEFGRTAKAWVSSAGVRARPEGDMVRRGGEETQRRSCTFMSGNIVATCSPQRGDQQKEQFYLNVSKSYLVPDPH